MKAPTLTKERRAWLQSLKDGADHKVVHINRHHLTAYATEVTVRWWADQQVLAAVTRTTLGFGVGTHYTKSGFSEDRRVEHDWIEPLTDARLAEFKVRRLRGELQRHSTWVKATDAQILACATALGLS